MELHEEQIKELMTTVACAKCGASYEYGSVEVLGRRDALWFLRVSCPSCSSRGLVAALVKSSEVTAVEAHRSTDLEPDLGTADQNLPAAAGPVTRADVAGMRAFLSGFDGDFKTLFGSDRGRPDRPAA